MSELEPVICLTKACNHKCIFCSRYGTDPTTPSTKIKKIISTFKGTLNIEGGEPMLAKNLIAWIEYAKKKNVKDVVLVTNGYSLDNKYKIKQLLKAGVDMFNVNFPSHIKKLYDLLTGTKNNYLQTVKTIETLIEVAGHKKVRLTYVLNKLNYKFLKNYAIFVARRFPGIFYVEVNMIKVLGAVKHRKWLVPSFKEMEEYLYDGFKTFVKLNLNFIVDGIPLCYMKGYEIFSIDTYKMIKGDKTHIGEKKHTPICKYCSYKNICPGIRTDYIAIYGYSELKPFKNPPVEIINIMREKFALKF